MEIANVAGGEGVEGGAERAHGGGEDTGDDESAETGGHNGEHEVREDFVGRNHAGFATGEEGVDVLLVEDVEQDADAEND